MRRPHGYQAEEVNQNDEHKLNCENLIGLVFSLVSFVTDDV